MLNEMTSIVAAGTEAAAQAGLSGNLAYALAALGAAIGIGLIGAKAAESTGRNPSASTPILVISIILAALIEGVALITILLK